MFLSQEIYYQIYFTAQTVLSVLFRMKTTYKPTCKTYHKKNLGILELIVSIHSLYGHNQSHMIPFNFSEWFSYVYAMFMLGVITFMQTPGLNIFISYCGIITVDHMTKIVSIL